MSFQAIVSKEYNINGETYTVLQGSTVEERLSLLPETAKGFIPRVPLRFATFIYVYNLFNPYREIRGFVVT